MRRHLASWIEFLGSKEAILLVLILALLAQLPHTAVVFQRVSTTVMEYALYGINVGGVIDLAHATMAAVAVEIAVLVFVVRGRSLLSWGFAVASATMNLIYYWRPGWRITEPTVLMIGAILWAVLLPAAIAFYSHEIGDGGQHEKHRNVWQRLGDWIASLMPRRTVAVQVAPAPAVAPVSSNGAVTAKPPKQKAVDVAANGNGESPFDAFAEAFADTVAMNGAIKNVAQDGVTQVDKVGQMDSEGLKTKQIAAQLGISESSVRVYRMQYKKNKTNQEAAA